MQADAGAIRQHLERVLASDTFRGAGRHSRLLRYLVERTLAGEGDQLKEYVLGTEVFDRPDSYDPRLDSIVRVEVRRLRSRLDEYYRGPGAGDSIVISIPRGSYVPEFDEPSVTPVESAPPPRQQRAGARVWAIAATLMIFVMLFTLRITLDRPPAAQAASGPGIAVLPFESYSTDQRDVLLAARITDAVTAELARMGTVSVASRTSAWQYAGERRPAQEIARALNVDLLLEASAEGSGDNLRVVVRLVDANRDRKVWVGEYTSSASDVRSLARRIAAESADGALAYRSRR